ncbi:Aste57867_10427 [Aphanomyces stellatus]|uniref:Aste57867_10427 protein n=1 Tax=Aphanomyces stellatus TaxID=120398 RepID=A0A485KRA6_9STRA|nr:hypothetical protein As57867_010387 [Aphanomyces stellatus]VFT87301.1 Aste57867_10427 [Aphanomyces stellatus]
MPTESWRKATSVAVGTLMLFALGSAYAISAWNTQLKAALGMTQAEISAVASCFTFGQYSMFFGGLLCDRFGVRVAIVVAAVLATGSYWVAAALVTSTAPPWTLAATFIVVGLGHAFPCIAVFAANEGIYGRTHRGKVFGLMSGSYSAGGAVVAYVYTAWFDHRVDAYFTFMGWSLLVASVLCMAFLGPQTDDAMLHDEATTLIDPSNDDDTTPNVTLVVLLHTRQFWHLFVAMLCGVGVPLFVLNNLSFVVESNGGDLAHVPSLVLAFSLANLVGRFTMAPLSDGFLHVVPRHRFLAGSIAFVGLVQVLFVVCPIDALVVPVVLTGFGEGCVFGIVPVVTRELFGPRHFGKNYGLVSLANAVGFPLVLGPLSTALYRMQLGPGTQTCLGSACFAPMFGIAAAVCGIATVCAARLRPPSASLANGVGTKL